MHNPSQVSVIQSQASHTSMDEDGITQGSVSNRMSVKDRRFSNLDAFNNILARSGNTPKQDGLRDDDSPGLQTSKLRR